MRCERRLMFGRAIKKSPSGKKRTRMGRATAKKVPGAVWRVKAAVIVVHKLALA